MLVNASPDLPEQLRRSPALYPRGKPRGSPIKAIMLTGAEIDQVAGLLSLREREPFMLCATAPTMALIDQNNMFEVLARDQVERRIVASGLACSLPGGLTAELFAVPGKVPLYLEGENPDTLSEEPLHIFDGAALNAPPGTIVPPRPGPYLSRPLICHS